MIPFDDQIPSQSEKLAVLVSTGKSKEAIGVRITPDQVKRLSDKDVQKYSKRYEAFIGNKTTESLIDSAIMLFSKGVGMADPIDDVKELQKELKNDYIINQELSSLAGGLALQCGRLLALANTALITTKHIKFEKEPENEQPYALPPTHQAETAKVTHWKVLMKLTKKSDRNLTETWQKPKKRSDRNLAGFLKILYIHDGGKTTRDDP